VVATVELNGKADSKTEATIVIDKIATETLLVPILGTAPLIVNRFTEKAKRQMLDKMQGRKSPKGIRDPEADYENAFYRFEDGSYGVPSLGFWLATIGAARFYSAVTMTALKQFLLPFRGEPGTDGTMLVKVTGEPHMREDAVTVGRTRDLRYRPEFWPWSTTLTVSYVSTLLSRSSVLSLIDAGGLGVGICEWRPERGGPFGTYRVDPDREVEVLR